MAITILAQVVVDKPSGGGASYTHGAFAVPGGTSRLLVQIEYRGYSSAAAPAPSSVTHNGDAVSFLAGSLTTGGFDKVTTWWGQRADPDIGTFNIAIMFPSDVRGIKIWLLAITGEKASGSILGQSAFQRRAGSATDTVGLGLTPAASNDSLLLASLSIAKATTLTSFTGTGWTAVATDNYTGGGNLTSTNRYRLNAPGGTASTVSAKFGTTYTNIGGSLIEILAEPTGTDVSDTFGVTLAVTGSVAGGASATIADASYRRVAAWTDAFAFQPDLAGVDRRIIAAGPASAPNLVVDQVATGSVYRARYRLTDGTVTADSAIGSQSAAAQHLAIVHGGPGGPVLYINGVPSVGSVTGGSLTGITDVGAGGETIGAHPTAPPGAYTGLIGRRLLYEGALSAEQVRLLALSQTDPDAIWGYGVEDDATEANQSPVAMPDTIRPNGRSTMRIVPPVIDPNGTHPEITAVTAPAHGSVSIGTDNDLVFNFEPGWVGKDNITYTVADTGGKSSTAKITIEQARPALKLVGDAVTVAAGSSITFDPRINDIGAGPLRVISVSTPSVGTAVILADGRIRYTAPSVPDPDPDPDPDPLIDSFIHVYPMEIDSPGSKTIVTPSVATNGEQSYSIPSNTIYDLRGTYTEVHKNASSGTPFRIASGASSGVFCGARSFSTNRRYWGDKDAASWASIHGDDSTGGGASGNYPSMRIDGASSGFKVQGIYLKQNMDGITPEVDGVIYENGCLKEIRDDCISNDGQQTGTFRNFYFQGHVWLSWRPGDPGEPGPGGGSPAPKNGKIMTFEYCLIDMDRMLWQGEDTGGKPGGKRQDKYYSPTNRNNTIIPVGTPGMGHQHPIKTRQVGDSGGMNARVIMRNCLMRITTPPVDAYDNLLLPKLGDGVGPGSTTGSYYENVHICWLGPPLTGTGYGPWPWPQTKAELAAMGITVHDNEAEAHNLWTAAKAAWELANGYDSSSDTFAWNRL